MITEEHKILIDKYIQGTLSETEKNVFEKLREDPAFEEELFFHEDLQQAVLLQHQNTFKERLIALKQKTAEKYNIPSQDFEEKQAGPTNSPKKDRVVNFRRVFAVAASIAILVTVGWLIFQNQINLSSKAEQLALFNENFQFYPNVIDPIYQGAEENDKTIEKQASQAYELGNYDQALQLFNSLEQKSDTVKLYTAIILVFQGNNLNTAIDYLKEVEQNDQLQMPIPQLAKWYLALTHLRLNDPDQSLQLLNEIISDANFPSDLRDKARNLAGELQKDD